MLKTFIAGAFALAAISTTAFAQQGRGGPPPPPTPAALQNYQPVTPERLKNPEPGNWLMIRRTYDGWGYSPLNQITTQNVAQLKPVWIFATGEPKVHEAAPLVNEGVMFVSTPNNQVIAIDAKSGNVLWRYRRPRPTGSNVPHDTSRGVALLGNRVYFAAGEAVLVALDAKTGREVWTTDVADNKSGYYISLAPLIAGGKVMVGASGGEYGIRGFVAAFDRGDRQGAVADVHHSRARRTRQRNLAQGRPVEERRRLRVGHRQLRSRHESRVLGRRQRRPLDGRSAPRR